MTRDSHSWRRVREIFDAALDVPEPERAQFVAAACGEDHALRRQIETLLAADGRRTAAAAFEGAPPVPVPAPASLPAGTRLGEYRILRVLGSGGMGVVYAAEQDRPHRVVALKVMQHGAASRQAERRLQVEAEVLARLNHPAIAHVFAVATAVLPDGRSVPYFAMELVEGATDLCSFAQAQGLDAAARLRLLIAVADAVHHGHQKGVIHRDLKPANVLVDAAGRPKVIDFGIARLDDGSEQTLLTQPGQIIGTLAYMSPEQIDGHAAAIDVRSDVYALGVIAYELLAQRLPLDLRGKSITAAAAAIRGQDPEPLAARNRAWRGDLDTIVMTAMAKDPNRRYASADALARDLERYLRREPIQARPPSAIYALGRFAARHRVAVAIAATALSLLLVGAGVLLVQNARIRAENAKARWVSAFLRDVLAQADGLEAHGERYTVREALDEATQRLAGATDIDPEIEAELRDTIGATYHGLSALAAAEPHLERAVQLRRAALGDGARETLASLGQLSLLRRDQDRLPDALRLARECFATAQAAFGADDEITLLSAHNLALLLKDTEALDDAEALARDTLARRRRVLGPDAKNTLHTAHNLGNLLLTRRDLEQAEDLLADTLARRERTLTAAHADTLITRDVLGQVLRERGEIDAAVAAHRAAAEGLEARLGVEHQASIGARFHLAWALLVRHDFAEAEGVGRTALERCRTVFGDEHRYTLRLLRIVAGAILHQGRGEDAAPLFEQAHAVAVRTHGERQREAVEAAHDLAFCLLCAGKPDAGLRVLAPLVGDDLPADLVATGELTRGRCLAGSGEAAAAEKSLRRSHEMFAAAGAAAGARASAISLAELCERDGRQEEAARWRAAAEK